MRSITLISAVAIAAIAMLVFLPSSMGEDKKCAKKSDCTKDTACVFVTKNSPVCKALAKDGEDCNFRKGNKRGQFWKHPPCEANLVCKKVKEEKNNKFHGKCEKKK